MGKPGRPKHSRKATVKQITALTLLDKIDPATNKPYSKRKAMLKAGYSERVAANPKKLMQSQAVTNLVEKFHLELRDEGVTTAYLAKKFKNALDAKKKILLKIGVDDNNKPIFDLIQEDDMNIQLQAMKMLKEVYGLQPSPKEPEGVKRRITLEEFINAEPGQQS